MAGADILALSRVAGHSSPSITLNVYAHELDDSTSLIRKAIDDIAIDSLWDRYGTDSKNKTASQELSGDFSFKYGKRECPCG